jgi:hypothetical protein
VVGRSLVISLPGETSFFFRGFQLVRKDVGIAEEFKGQLSCLFPLVRKIERGVVVPPAVYAYVGSVLLRRARVEEGLAEAVGQCSRYSLGEIWLNLPLLGPRRPDIPQPFLTSPHFTPLRPRPQPSVPHAAAPNAPKSSQPGTKKGSNVEAKRGPVHSDTARSPLSSGTAQIGSTNWEDPCPEL